MLATAAVHFLYKIYIKLLFYLLWDKVKVHYIQQYSISWLLLCISYMKYILNYFIFYGIRWCIIYSSTALVLATAPVQGPLVRCNLVQAVELVVVVIHLPNKPHPPVIMIQGGVYQLLKLHHQQ